MLRVQGAHTFSRGTVRSDTDLKTLNGTTLASNQSFKFNELESYTEFTTLFESYRIRKIVVTVQLVTNPNCSTSLNSTVTANPSNFFPKIWYAVDHDGGDDDTISSMKQRQGVKCRILQPNKVVKISFKPMCRVQTYKTATTSGTGSRNLKVDMADVDVPHYGLTWVLDTNLLDPSDTYPFRVMFEYKYYFTCYGVR